MEVKRIYVDPLNKILAMCLQVWVGVVGELMAIQYQSLHFIDIHINIHKVDIHVTFYQKYTIIIFTLPTNTLTTHNTLFFSAFMSIKRL